MKRTSHRRLSIRRETLRRLASDDLAQVAGGACTRCTYERSGCKAPESATCDSKECPGDTTDSKYC